MHKPYEIPLQGTWISLYKTPAIRAMCGISVLAELGLKWGEEAVS